MPTNRLSWRPWLSFLQAAIDHSLDLRTGNNITCSMQDIDNGRVWIGGTLLDMHGDTGVASTHLTNSSKDRERQYSF